MDDESTRAIQLFDELQSWTLQAIRSISLDLHTTPEDGLPGGPTSCQPRHRFDARHALVAVVGPGLISRLHPASLPARALELTCRYLSLKDRIALSQTSRGVRNTLVNLPSVWSDMDSRRPRKCTLNLGLLQALAHRSADNQLALSVTLDCTNAFQGLEKVSLILDRISALTLRIKYDGDISLATTTEPRIWQSTIDALVTAAPNMTYFDLLFAERLAETIDNVPFYYLHPLHDAPLSSTIFAGHAPLLRTLRLNGVRLPCMACQTFLSVTYFHFTWAGRIDEMLRALDMMPHLETLILQAAFLFTTPLEGGNRRPTFKSLRNLFLLADVIDSQSLCGVLDFRRLRYLDMEHALGRDALIAEAYPTHSMTRLVITYMANVITVQDEAGNPQTTIRAYNAFSFMPFLLEPCSAVTWLAVHESHWPGNSLWNVTLPAMPAVTSVRICLAACREPTSESRVGILVHCEPGSAWHLPALRELCITAPSSCPAKHSTCLGTRSVALAEVARFVRLGVQFDAPKLDEVRLAGLRVVDPDFCAAWEEMSTVALAVELVEEPEVIPHMDLWFNYDYEEEIYFSSRRRET